MTSILTNTAAMSALQSLSATQRQLSTTQAQVSSGLAVSSPSDNAAYWSIGKIMSAQVSGLAAVQDSLSLTKSIADVTATALGSIKNSLDRIQADVVAAGQSGISPSALQADISAQQQSILNVANSASFNGINWLRNTVSSNTTVTTNLDIDVPEDDYKQILTGQEVNAISNFDSSVDETTDTNFDGTDSASTVNYGFHVTTTDAPDGTVNTDRVAKTSTTSGSTDPLDLGTVSVPMSESAAGGLVKSQFSLAPIALFSDYAGTYRDIQNVTFGGMQDPVDSYDITSSAPITHSYDGYGGGAHPGILDVSMQISDDNAGALVGASTTSNQQNGAPQSILALGVDGGAVIPVNQSSVTGQTTPVIRESILNLNIVGTSASDLAVIRKTLQTAITGIIGASGVIGSLQTEISNQQTFNASLSDALTSGIGSLVDADMNVASTRLQALQTQQQLGIQSLSIANQNGQLIMKLFQAA